MISSARQQDLLSEAEPAAPAAQARPRLRSGRLLLLALLLFGVAFAGLFRSQGNLLTWDEVDYVNAARAGVTGNMLERGSLSAAQFLSFVRAKMHLAPPLLPPWYDEARDPLQLRHYHPPLVPMLMAPMASATSEHVLRGVQLLGALALLLVLLLAYREISPAPTPLGLATISVLGLWAALTVFRSISFHGWEAVFTTATALLLACWLRRPTRALGLAVCASTALALLTLQTGLFVWASVVLAILLLHRALPDRKIPWRLLIVGTVLTAALAVALWPGCLLKISLLKIVALYAYMIRRGQEYASVGSRVPVLLRALSPMIFAAPIAVLWLWRKGRDRVALWGPFVVIGGFYIFACARFALNPIYLVPGLAPLAVVVACMIDSLPARRLGAAVLALAALALVPSWHTLRQAGDDDAAVRADLDFLRTSARGRSLLADGGHIYRHYLGPQYAVETITVSENGKELQVREHGAYRALSLSELSGRLLAVRSERAQFFGSPLEQEVLGACRSTVRLTLRLYDCARAP